MTIPLILLGVLEAAGPSSAHEVSRNVAHLAELTGRPSSVIDTRVRAIREHGFDENRFVEHVLVDHTDWSKASRNSVGALLVELIHERAVQTLAAMDAAFICRAGEARDRQDYREVEVVCSSPKDTRATLRLTQSGRVFDVEVEGVLLSRQYRSMVNALDRRGGPALVLERLRAKSSSMGHSGRPDR